MVQNNDPRRGDKGDGREGGGQFQTHFAILGKIDLERLGIVFEPERGHGEQDVFAIHRLALLLLAFLGCCATLVNRPSSSPRHPAHIPSLVMNEMNSLTHSCMHSLASFAILAFSGSAVFMMRATGAKLRMLASDVAANDEEDAGAERATCCRGRELVATVSEDMTSKDRMGGGREQASEWTATRPDRGEARCDASHG